MREILFKAKRIDNGEWVEGFLFHCLNNGEEWCIGNEPLSANDYSEIIGEYRTWFSIDESTICQYTGLTDKNGKKIWENDILREYADTDSLGNDLYYYYKVFWDSCNSEYGVKNDVESMGLVCVCTNESEVIGNIFDNPELMKEGGKHE